MKLNRKKKSENSERWLLTYSDLITLLMIFFVVMYASSSINSTKYAKLSKSLNGVLSNGNSGIFDETSSSLGGDPAPIIVDAEEEKLTTLKNSIDSSLKEQGLSDYVGTEIQERGLIISLSDSIFFESGKADIKTEVKPELDKISSSLKSIDNLIRVEGHTDNVPEKSNVFSSNWQLSAVRAANVVQYLIDVDGLPPNRLSAAGYGDTRNIASNDTKEGKSKNRRIDIVILSANNKKDS